MIFGANILPKKKLAILRKSEKNKFEKTHAYFVLMRFFVNVPIAAVMPQNETKETQKCKKNK